MTAPDFRERLSKPAASAKKPKALPAGSYHGFIDRREFGESAKKKTAQVTFFLNQLVPGEDVDQAALADIDMAKKELRTIYYLTDSSDYRVVELAQSCGLNTDGMSIAECIENVLKQPVLITVTQRNSEDGKDVYNDVKDLVGTAGAQS